ncbi:bifunctional adenosylcobinamide kinase/adenosylcobinamide-phosphate guanylyltransferase [Hydrococcus rivularis NIES-593]|uniref:Adenosylcobinamide kinase n=1 Tax=Hydrococcus rivularis NIES-593 TaxID=1921803 RepID=A0A1U7HHD9_9CYAN|nr:bifunctional adenosylcobinamide kinase/adenosylcobinamide-phosphate guanylyltransferase [Hydrococcus rivularis]OKH22965.1 bifunctional adenosylcobinamide kinase/adenosylcobinamide-phosphate guanylyltransferase [Hydrococcus rivularis NIES-593]
MNRSRFPSRQIILVTGAARSGKSEWAETLATQTGKSVVYVATATIDPSDSQWQARIEKHRLRRPAEWQTLQVPIELAATFEAATPPQCLLVDSLGTWVANLLDRDETTWENIAFELLDRLQQAAVDIILVAEETGWGVVPAYPSGRLFRDRLGDLVRQIGAIADSVYLVVGGHVLNLTLLGKPLKNSKLSSQGN